MNENRQRTAAAAVATVFARGKDGGLDGGQKGRKDTRAQTKTGAAGTLQQ